MLHILAKTKAKAHKSLPSPSTPTLTTKSIDSGPRVKHVSRSAKMAQGEPALLQTANFRLSALPPDEKCKIWNEEQSMLREFSDDEDIEESKVAKTTYNWLVTETDPKYVYFGRCGYAEVQN